MNPEQFPGILLLMVSDDINNTPPSVNNPTGKLNGRAVKFEDIKRLEKAVLNLTNSSDLKKLTDTLDQLQKILAYCKYGVKPSALSTSRYSISTDEGTRQLSPYFGPIPDEVSDPEQFRKEHLLPSDIVGLWGDLAVWAGIEPHFSTSDAQLRELGQPKDPTEFDDALDEDSFLRNIFEGKVTPSIGEIQTALAAAKSEGGGVRITSDDAKSTTSPRLSSAVVATTRSIQSGGAGSGSSASEATTQQAADRRREQVIRYEELWLQNALVYDLFSRHGIQPDQEILSELHRNISGLLHTQSSEQLSELFANASRRLELYRQLQTKVSGGVLPKLIAAQYAAHLQKLEALGPDIAQDFLAETGFRPNAIPDLSHLLNPSTVAQPVDAAINSLASFVRGGQASPVQTQNLTTQLSAIALGLGDRQISEELGLRFDKNKADMTQYIESLDEVALFHLLYPEAKQLDKQILAFISSNQKELKRKLIVTSQLIVVEKIAQLSVTSPATGVTASVTGQPVSNDTQQQVVAMFNLSQGGSADVASLAAAEPAETQLESQKAYAHFVEQLLATWSMLPADVQVMLYQEAGMDVAVGRQKAQLEGSLPFDSRLVSAFGSLPIFLRNAAEITRLEKTVEEGLRQPNLTPEKQKALLQTVHSIQLLGQHAKAEELNRQISAAMLSSLSDSQRQFVTAIAALNEADRLVASASSYYESANQLAAAGLESGPSDGLVRELQSYNYGFLSSIQQAQKHLSLDLNSLPNCQAKSELLSQQVSLAEQLNRLTSLSQPQLPKYSADSPTNLDSASAPNEYWSLVLAAAAADALAESTSTQVLFEVEVPIVGPEPAQSSVEQSLTDYSPAQLSEGVESYNQFAENKMLKQRFGRQPKRISNAIRGKALAKVGQKMAGSAAAGTAEAAAGVASGGVGAAVIGAGVAAIKFVKKTIEFLKNPKKFFDSLSLLDLPDTKTILVQLGGLAVSAALGLIGLLGPVGLAIVGGAVLGGIGLILAGGAGGLFGAGIGGFLGHHFSPNLAAKTAGRLAPSSQNIGSQTSTGTLHSNPTSGLNGGLSTSGQVSQSASSTANGAMGTGTGGGSTLVPSTSAAVTTNAGTSTLLTASGTLIALDIASAATWMPVASVGFLTILTTVVIFTIFAAFLSPLPVGTGMSVAGGSSNQYINLVKSVTPNQIPNDTLAAGPVTVTYTITITPKLGNQIKLSNISDNISSLPETPQLPAKKAVWVTDPENYVGVELFPDPITNGTQIEYLVTFQRGADALVLNTIHITYDVIGPNGETIAAGEEFTDTASVRIGQPQVFCWPTTGTITQIPCYKGAPSDGTHCRYREDAYDIANNAGPLVYAPMDGTVVIPPFDAAGYGKHIILKINFNGKTRELFFGHFDSIAAGLVSGSHVGVGQQLGRMGNTGNSTGTHLHFELKWIVNDPLRLDNLLPARPEPKLGTTITSCYQ